MTNEEYGKVIARNLKRIAYDNHKTQIEIAKDLGLKQSTVSSWMNGTRIPRMGKIDLLCSYFNCSREEIMEEEPKRRSERISDSEQELLRLFRKLNSAGQNEAIRALSNLALAPVYTDKKEPSSISHTA